MAFDASEPAGVARLKFGMKQIIQWDSGGAPKALDLIVTMLVSRKNFQSDWLINEVNATEKPKS
jgi:hypothetical protein